MANISSMSVQLNLLSKGFTRGLKKARISLRKFAFTVTITKKVINVLGSAILKTGKFVLKWGSIIAAFVTGAFTVWIRKTMLSIDQVTKLAQVIGITTKEFTAFRFGAQIAGASIKELDRALTIFGRRIGEAVAGTGEAVKGFETLGVSAQVLTNLDLGTSLKIISERIKLLPTATQQAAVAFQLFGRQGVQILNFLKLGAQGIEDLVIEAEKLGVVFGAFDAAKVEAANDSLERLQAVLVGLGQQISIRISPLMTGMVNSFVDWAVAGESAGDKVSKVFDLIVNSIAKGLDGLEKFGVVLSTIFDQLKPIFEDIKGFVLGFSKPFVVLADLVFRIFRELTLTIINAEVTALKVAARIQSILNPFASVNVFEIAAQFAEASIKPLEEADTLAKFNEFVKKAMVEIGEDASEFFIGSFSTELENNLAELSKKKSLGDKFLDLISGFEAKGLKSAEKLFNKITAPLAEEETPFEKAATRAEGKWKKVTKEIEKALGVFKQAKLFTIGFDLLPFPTDERDRSRFEPKEQKRRSGTDVFGRTKSEFEAEQRRDAELRAVERTADASEQLVEQGGLSSGLALAG